VADAVADIRSRLQREMSGVERQISDLQSALAKLQQAYDALGGTTSASTRRSTRRRTTRSASSNGRRRTSSGRAPRGAAREGILAEVKKRPGASLGEIINAVMKSGAYRLEGLEATTQSDGW
jgi:hypothetical protein